MKPSISSLLPFLAASLVSVGTHLGWVAPALRERALTQDQMAQTLEKIQKTMASLSQKNIAPGFVAQNCPPSVVVRSVVAEEAVSVPPQLVASASSAPTPEQVSEFMKAQSVLDEAVSKGRITHEKEREMFSLVAGLSPEHAQETLLSYAKNINDGLIVLENFP